MTESRVARLHEVGESQVASFGRRLAGITQTSAGGNNNSISRMSTHPAGTKSFEIFKQARHFIHQRGEGR